MHPKMKDKTSKVAKTIKYETGQKPVSILGRVSIC